MNSRTSRPRSPTSAITLTSAVVERAIMPSSDDLPTPEPAKMPRRWPRPHGHQRVERAHAEADPLADPRARRAGRAGRRSSSARRAPSGRAEPSSGVAEAVDDAPEQRLADGHAERRAGRHAPSCPGRSRAARRAASAACGRSRKPTTSVATGWRVAAVADQAHLADLDLRAPVASMISPIRSLTRPRRRARSLRCERGVARREGRRLASSSGLVVVAPLSCARRRSRGRAASCVVDAARRSRPSSVRTTAPPRPIRRSACTSQLLDPAELGPQRRTDCARDELEIGGVDERRVTRWRSVIRRSASAHHVEHALGLAPSSAPATICSASAQRQLDGVALERRGQLLAQPLDRATRARRARRAPASISACAAARPAARPSASPVSARLGADLLGLGPGAGEHIGPPPAGPAGGRLAAARRRSRDPPRAVR